MGTSLGLVSPCVLPGAALLQPGCAQPPWKWALSPELTPLPACRNRAKEQQNRRDGGAGGMRRYLEMKSRKRDGMRITVVKNKQTNIKTRVLILSLPELLDINSNSCMHLICGYRPESALQRMGLGKVTGSKEDSFFADHVSSSSHYALIQQSSQRYAWL